MPANEMVRDSDKLMLNKLFARSCRQVTRLLSDREERPLAWHERVALRTHLKVCDACTRYESQLKFMRKAMGRWSKYSDEP